MKKNICRVISLILVWMLLCLCSAQAKILYSNTLYFGNIVIRVTEDAVSIGMTDEATEDAEGFTLPIATDEPRAENETETAGGADNETAGEPEADVPKTDEPTGEPIDEPENDEPTGEPIDEPETDEPTEEPIDEPESDEPEADEPETEETKTDENKEKQRKIPITDEELANAMWLQDIVDEFNEGCSIELYVIAKDNRIVLGEPITLVAVLHGYENSEFTLQWQESEDDLNWFDLEGEDDYRLTVILDRTNNGHFWRIKVNVTNILLTDEQLQALNETEEPGSAETDELPQTVQDSEDNED